MSLKDCPKCGNTCELTDKFCFVCGADLGRVKARGAPVPSAPPPPPASDEPTGALAVGIWFLNMFPGLLSVKVIILSVALIAVAALLVKLALAFMMMDVIIAILIGALGLVAYWTAIGWLLYGDVCVPSEALAEFDGTKWMTFVLLTAVPFGAAFWRMKAGAG